MNRELTPERRAQKHARYLKHKAEYAAQRKRQWARIKADPAEHAALLKRRREQYATSAEVSEFEPVDSALARELQSKWAARFGADPPTHKSLLSCVRH